MTWENYSRKWQGFFPFHCIFQVDIGKQNYTDFGCTIPQHTICTVYCVFTIPSQVSVHHHLSSLYLLPPAPSNHHTHVHVHEFFPKALHCPPTVFNLLSMSLSLYCFLVHFLHYILHMSEIIWHVFLLMAYFTQHNALQIHPCCLKG